MTDNITPSASIESPLNEVSVEQAPAVEEAATTGPSIPEKFNGDVTKLVESYNSLESKIGSMYSVPTEDSSPEKWSEFEQRITGTGKFLSRPDPSDAEGMAKFYNQLGRPESAADYSVDIAEEVKPYIDQNAYGQYTQVAHDAGLNNEQAQVLLDYEVERMNAQAAQTMQVRTEAEQQLRQNWGAEYDTRVAGAKTAASVYSEKYPDAVNQLINGPEGNNPALIAMLSELGHSLRESGHVGAINTPQYGMSSDDAQGKIREIMDNKSHAYFNNSDPGHGQAVSKVKKLYSIAYPEG